MPTPCTWQCGKPPRPPGCRPGPSATRPQFRLQVISFQRSAQVRLHCQPFQACPSGRASTSLRWSAESLSQALAARHSKAVTPVGGGSFRDRQRRALAACTSAVVASCISQRRPPHKAPARTPEEKILPVNNQPDLGAAGEAMAVSSRLACAKSAADTLGSQSPLMIRSSSERPCTCLRLAGPRSKEFVETMPSLSGFLAMLFMS
jgi:hypothetical protein